MRHFALQLIFSAFSSVFCTLFLWSYLMWILQFFFAIFCISSNPLVTRHGCCKYYSWLLIFVWRRLLTVWAMWIWLSSSETLPSKSSTFFRWSLMLFCCSSKRALAAIRLCLLVTAEEGLDEFGDNVELLVLSCFVLGVCWMCFWLLFLMLY